MAVARYRYVFADLLTDQTITEFELADVSFDRRIIQPGAFKASIPVPNAKIAAKAKRIVPTLGEIGTGPGRTVVHIYRNGEIWGTYILWSATPSADDRGRIKVEIQGASLESYLYRREIRNDIAFLDTEQTDIAADLISGMQAEPEGDLSITPTTIPTGFPRDRTYFGSESATFGQRLEELANVIDGFEYAISTYLDDSGVRVREFVAATQLGVDDLFLDQVFARPGNIQTWTYPSDATKAATSYRASGDATNDDVTEASQALMSDTYTAGALLDSGWPLLDQTVSYQGVTQLDTLNGYARWWALTRPGAVRIPQITVRIPDATGFSPSLLGCYARISVVDDWFGRLPDGSPIFNQRWRIVGMEITPPTRQGGQEMARLIFAEDVSS